jgi:hypothetical protein
MRRRLLLTVALVLAACSPPEADESPPQPIAAQIRALAEMTGEAAEDLSQDPCVIGCAGAAVEGCQPVLDTCDTALVAPFSGVWMTCGEAVQAACESTAGLYACAIACRARVGRSG